MYYTNKQTRTSIIERVLFLMDNIMKLNLPFLLTVYCIFSSAAYGDINEHQQLHECSISGCKVACYSSDGEQIRSTKGRKVLVTYLPTGTTIFEVESSFNRSETIVANYNGYLCSVEGSRKNTVSSFVLSP